jgi:hypothetical protein
VTSREDRNSDSDGVSAEFLERLREAGASSDLIEKLEFGGEPLRSPWYRRLSLLLPTEVGMIAAAVAAFIGDDSGVRAVAVGILAAGAVAIGALLRKQEEGRVPPVRPKDE